MSWRRSALVAAETCSAGLGRLWREIGKLTLKQGTVSQRNAKLGQLAVAGYVHEWRSGDLVVWDNCATLHRGRRYDIGERRERRRTTIDDTPEAMLDAA